MEQQNLLENDLDKINLNEEKNNYGVNYIYLFLQDKIYN